jgi:DNA repair protein RecO (recombination protein O)
LTAAQYWGEVTLYQALSHQPQEELFLLLVEHLQRLDRSRSEAEVLPLLVQGLYHLLAIAGVAPQVRACADCPGSSDLAFSPDSGGVACQTCVGRQRPLQRSIVSGKIRAALHVLPEAQLPELASSEVRVWLGVERLLRRTVQYHFDRTIRSAALVEPCFRPLAASVS